MEKKYSIYLLIWTFLKQNTDKDAKLTVSNSIFVPICRKATYWQVI
jgi:hypothetical protein